MKDKSAIDKLVAAFFDIFSNGQKEPDWTIIYTICIPQTIIIKKKGLTEDIYTLQTFLEPRKKILSDGTLQQFEEHETGEETRISGHIAQRFSTYQKTGWLNGAYFQGNGNKCFQFIKTTDGWKINALIWEDN